MAGQRGGAKGTGGPRKWGRDSGTYEFGAQIAVHHGQATWTLTLSGDAGRELIYRYRWIVSREVEGRLQSGWDILSAPRLRVYSPPIKNENCAEPCVGFRQPYFGRCPCVP
jgi:hypothetical protein